jgi:hypothetical protein
LANATPIPRWSHAVENTDGVWSCTASMEPPDDRGERRYRDCQFTSADLGEAMSHVSASQYDWRHAEPVDRKGA